MSYSIDTDLQAHLPFELEPVPVVSAMNASDFRRSIRRAGVPIVVREAMDAWPALEEWQDGQRMVDLVGADTEVYCRQVADAAEEFAETYESTRFGQLVKQVFDDRSSRDYLTQGLVFEAQGMLSATARTTYPALLQALAVDADVPDLIDRRDVAEGVLWLGAGGQTTPLHFDDVDNLNCVVLGRKRWVLFPPSEIRHLLVDGRDGRGSVLSSLEQLTAGDVWHGGSVEKAYTCETGPGEMLYVPGGYSHQVFSSSDPNVAINFWFIDTRDPTSIARFLRDRSLRRMGCRSPLKRAVWASALLLGMAALAVRHRVRPSALRTPDFEFGPTSYDLASGL